MEFSVYTEINGSQPWLPGALLKTPMPGSSLQVHCIGCFNIKLGLRSTN